MKKTLTIIVLSLFCGLYACAQTGEFCEYNLGKGLEMYKEGNIPEAKRYVDLHLKENPQSADALYIKSRLFIEEEKFANAIEILGKAIKYWKRGTVIQKSSLYRCRSSIFIILEKYDKAIEDLTSAYKLAIKDDEDSVFSILNERAEVYYSLNNLDAADSDYRLILKHNESNLMAMVGLARNMIQRKEYKDAVAMLDDCSKYDKAYSEVYHYRMLAHDGLGKTDKAIDDVFSYFEYADDVDWDLTSPILRKHVGYAFAKVNAKITSDSRNYFWVWVRIRLHETCKDYVSAIDDYNTIESEIGAQEQIYYGRALCYQKLGLYDKAITDINKCILLSGEDYALLQTRGDIYREASRYEDAIADFARGIELLSTNAFSYYARGWCYELMGNGELAMKDYCSGIDVDKSYPYIYLMRGDMYLKRGEVENAKADFEQILRIDTVAVSGSCRHYALHFFEKDDEAIEWIDDIIASDSEDSGLYYDKACLLGRMGRVYEAVATLAVALEKGFCSFGHIENDDDMDVLRSHPDFQALINNYKAKQRPMIEEVGKGKNDEISIISEIQMKKMYSGVYEVGCNVNALPLKFILDTGASSVSISSVEASFMLKNGYLTADDIKGKEYFRTATGEIREGTTIRLREIRIGNAVLRNVDASVSHSQQASLLLGQSVLERFGTITIDNINSKLIIKQ